jgi:hypothetical protein
MADAEGTKNFMHQSSLTQIECLGITLSSDATSVRGENYEGAHVMINNGSFHKMRILSLTSTVSHSSETQLENLKKQIRNIADVYRRTRGNRFAKFTLHLEIFFLSENRDPSPPPRKGNYHFRK